MRVRTLLVACSVATLAAATADAATFKDIHDAKMNIASELFLTGTHFGQPLLGPNGVLYGVATDGGPNKFNGGTKEFGVFYSLTPPAPGKKTWPYKILHTFRFNNKEKMVSPDGPLLSDGAGGFFGTTLYGAAGVLENGGAVYHLVPNGTTYMINTLYQFDGAGEGAYLTDGVIADSAGNLYGTTTINGTNGGGTVFKLTPPAPGLKNWTLTTLHSFAASNGKGQPRGGLLRDASGNLYGVTQFDGASNAGTVYQLTLQADGSYSYSVLYNFTGGADGGTPSGGLLADAAGNLYGTVSTGGDNGKGAVFKLTPGAGGFTEEVLYSFTGNGNGAEPNGGVMMDAAGNLFGGTKSGGFVNPNTTFSFGTLYKLSPPVSGGSWDFTLLNAFTRETLNGASPTTRLIQDGAGRIFGATKNGGIDGEGMIFEVTP